MIYIQRTFCFAWISFWNVPFFWMMITISYEMLINYTKMHNTIWTKQHFCLWMRRVYLITEVWRPYVNRRIDVIEFYHFLQLAIFVCHVCRDGLIIIYISTHRYTLIMYVSLNQLYPHCYALTIRISNSNMPGVVWWNYKHNLLLVFMKIRNQCINCYFKCV